MDPLLCWSSEPNDPLASALRTILNRGDAMNGGIPPISLLPPTFPCGGTRRRKHLREETPEAIHCPSPLSTDNTISTFPASSEGVNGF